MWRLALYFPLLIGTCVPEDDEYWNLLCLLLQILFSPTINKGQIPYLQVLIQQHHEKLKNCFQSVLLFQKCTI